LLVKDKANINMQSFFRKVITILLLPILIQSAAYAQQKGNGQMGQMLDLSGQETIMHSFSNSP
jgi:hypothetical protein